MNRLNNEGLFFTYFKIWEDILINIYLYKYVYLYGVVFLLPWAQYGSAKHRLTDWHYYDHFIHAKLRPREVG